MAGRNFWLLKKTFGSVQLSFPAQAEKPFPGEIVNTIAGV